MLNFCSLYSGSSGNSLYLEIPNTKILIDAGESCKKITDALASINVDVKEIDAILITHEHSDHIKGVGTISKKYNIPVYANSLTWNSTPMQNQNINTNNRKIFKTNKEFTFGGLTIYPFSIPHDASDPCGFNIYYENTKISIATDVGHLTNEIIGNLEKSSFILLESNYDPDVLKCSSYPYRLKERIAGPYGHLSNISAGKAISHLLNTGLKSVMLGHLSEENNFPELAYKTVVNEIIENNSDFNLSSLTISVANRYQPSSMIKLN